MADAARGAQPGPWYLTAWRAAGAGLVGAAVGAAVAGIWHAGSEAAGHACPATVDTLCFPVLPAGEAVLGSGLVICAVVFVGFLLLRVRLKRLTIPVGCVLCVVLIWAVGSGTGLGAPPPAWAAALVAGAGLTSLALLVESGRAQIAGVVAIVVVAAAAFTVPRLVHSRMQQDAREQQLAALGFPLLAPVAAGYHASGAEAVTGSLSVSMSSDTPGTSALSRLAAFTVTITPPSASSTGPGPGGKPEQCQYLPRRGCRELKRGLWLLSNATGPEVITWRGDVEVDAMSLGYSPVSVKALVQAATDLHPASAAALAGLGP
jgi:hypothetical protein